jgi:shikimate dehydrogenase
MPKGEFTGLLPSGTTIVYTMIGHPVVQVKSPLNFNRYFARHSIDGVMVAVDVHPEQVKAYFDLVRRIPNFGGCCVTVPHKSIAFECMDDVSARARDLKAVNVVRVEKRRLIGDMVDGAGFGLALQAHGLNIAGKRAAIIGVGGAGAAIAHRLAECGAAEIWIKERDIQRHGFIVRLLKQVNPDTKVSFELTSLKKLDLVVNASPVGMNGDLDLPFPVETLASNCLVADVVTQPALTPWLAAARAKGCEIQYGAEMAYAQIGLLGRHMGLDIPDPHDILSLD